MQAVDLKHKALKTKLSIFPYLFVPVLGADVEKLIDFEGHKKARKDQFLHPLPLPVRCRAKRGPRNGVKLSVRMSREFREGSRRKKCEFCDDCRAIIAVPKAVIIITGRVYQTQKRRT
jgi:hypothetical protein